MKKLLAVLLVAVLVFSLAACGSKGDGDTTKPSETDNKAKTVVFIPKLTGNAFFESANNGAQEYSKKWGFTVDYQGSANAAVADQVQVINNAIAQGVDAICVSSVDATGLDAALKEAIAAGIQVVTWDSDVSDDARSLMVSQGTPDILGKMLVDMGVTSLKNRGVDVDGAVKYCWHYSQSTVADQNSWQVEGEKYIKENYPSWVNVAPDNYYSEQDAERAVSTGASILEANPDIDLIICNDSTALPGQAKAAQNKGLTAQDVTITGFASPQSMADYCKAGVIERWGLWDCGVQGAIGCYLAYYLASGNTVKVGDKIDIPEIGTVEILANDCLVPGASTADTNNGVVLLPERLEFTSENVDNYDF